MDLARQAGEGLQGLGAPRDCDLRLGACAAPGRHVSAASQSYGDGVPWGAGVATAVPRLKALRFIPWFLPRDESELAITKRYTANCETRLRGTRNHTHLH